MPLEERLRRIEQRILKLELNLSLDYIDTRIDRRFQSYTTKTNLTKTVKPLLKQIVGEMLDEQ